MTTFFIEQFGCRATQADGAALEAQLRARGCSVAEEATSADIVVVNTCTVTAAADAQARDAIRQIRKRNPGVRFLVTGCYAQRAPEELAALPGVAWVVGNSHKPQIPLLLEEFGNKQAAEQNFVPAAAIGTAPQGDSGVLSLEQGPAKILSGDILQQRTFLPATVVGGEGHHTRPVLKIQDGCDSRCSYCVIPFVRGRSRSLPPEEVVKEVRRLSESGRREIVLSGINLGTYGRDLSPRAELGPLLRRILDETEVERLRISSIEPLDVTEDLVRLFRSNERIARHFHMPLQSGCDRILAGMRRWYRAEHYERRVELIRAQMPDAAIGADVIAGFPGETEEEHGATLAFLRRLPLTYLHVFSFSKRPGTHAATLGGEVAPAVIQRRAREVRALGEKKNARFLAEQSGRQLRILTLQHPKNALRDCDWTPALSGNYLQVRLAGKWPANEMVTARVWAGPSGQAHAQAETPCAIPVEPLRVA